MIHVALIADDYYLQNLAVALRSISLNSKAELTIHIFLFELSERLIEDLKKCVDLSRIDLCFYRIDLSLLGDLEGDLPAHVSKTAFYRIFLPRLLPKLSRIIYLDCDVLVRKDLDLLWEQDISMTGAAAVVDATVPKIGSKNGVVDFQRLGIDPDLSYCNTGVVLIDLDFWRKEDVEKKAVDYITFDCGRSRYIDQAALNAALLGRWTILDPSWNVQTLDYYRKSNRMEMRIIADAVFDPKIVHFTGPRSPARVVSRHPYSALWQIYLSETPFSKGSWLFVELKIRLTQIFYRLMRFLKLAKPVASFRL